MHRRGRSPVPYGLEDVIKRYIATPEFECCERELLGVQSLRTPKTRYVILPVHLLPHLVVPPWGPARPPVPRGPPPASPSDPQTKQIKKGMFVDQPTSTPLKTYPTCFRWGGVTERLTDASERAVA